MTEALAGRDGPLAEIAAALGRGDPVIVHGSRGSGRTAVLAEVARRQGGRVLAARALPGDEALPGSGLHRLLMPVHDRIATLEPSVTAVLAQFFGSDPASADPASLTDVVRRMSRTPAGDAGYLWVVDDLDRFDAVSRDVLAGLGRPVLAGAVTRDCAPAMTAVRLGRLSRTDAARLLAALPDVRGHPGARLVLSQARGNPLALTELARHLPDPTDLAPTATELPVPSRLRHALAPAVGLLRPTGLRAALLAAVAAETPGSATAAALDALVRPGVWRQLVADGVLRSGRRFTHPVVRAAVIDRAGPAAACAARLDLAGRLPSGDPARAWHLARAAPVPDESLAATLDRAGDRLTDAGRTGAAAYALGLAAARSCDPAAAGRRASRAAHLALLAGDQEWSAELSAGSGGEVHLLRALRTAWMRGDEPSRQAVRESLRNGGAGESDAMAIWARVVADDEDTGGQAQRLLHEGHRPGSHDTMPPDEYALALGTIAVARHDSLSAVRHLTRALDLAAPGGPHRGLALIAMAWVRYDVGDIGAACRAARQALVTAGPAGIWADVRAGALALLASVAVLRDDSDREDRLRDAQDAMQPVRHASYDLRLVRARGLADAIAGRHALAYHRLRSQYDTLGRPVHHRISDLGLADLVHVAVVLGREDQVVPIMAGAEPRVRALGSARVEAVWHRAKALLAGADPIAETDHRLALAGPDGDRWPVERARTLMDYAQWLRRRHRPAESRPLLVAARDVFAANGMGAWRQRAEAELAAAAPPRRPGVPAAGLTPQQREVVRLAAQGLTNVRIAERLNISARTVGTHLSRAYPILGVTRRTQLPSVLGRL